MNHFDYEIKEIPACRAMGIKCDVSFDEIETIKNVIQTLESRVHELPYAINKEIRWGLSYHLRPDGFTYYSVYEVTDQQQLPDNMVEVNIPKMTYLTTKYEGGSIEEIYIKMKNWVDESQEEYKLFTEVDVTYYDELPIKFEKHTQYSDPNQLHFEVFIPLVKR